MNLFFLSKNPKKAAKYHCNKHIVKMILELVQMLYSAHYNNMKEGWQTFFIDRNLTPYKPAHINHPITLWISEDIRNYRYALRMLVAIIKEKKKRFPNTEASACKPHINAFVEEYNLKLYKICENKSLEIREKLNIHPKNIPSTTGCNLTLFPLVIPKECFVKNDDGTYNTVLSYRKYYNVEKRKMAEWYIREGKDKILINPPEWFK